MKISVIEYNTRNIVSNFVPLYINPMYESDIVLKFNLNANYQERYYLFKNRFGAAKLYIDYIDHIRIYAREVSFEEISEIKSLVLKCHKESLIKSIIE
jgi:hypothetical protein